MTPCKVQLSEPGEAALDGGEAGFGRARVLFESVILTHKVEEMAIADAHLSSVWGERLFRILFVAERPLRQASWTVRILGTDAALNAPPV